MDSDAGASQEPLLVVVQRTLARLIMYVLTFRVLQVLEIICH